MKWIVLIVACLTAVPAHSLVTMDVGIQWRGELSMHGRWVWMQGVGDVWVPTVNTTWQPYVSGYWDWSPWGWMWASYEPWGNITYHYGRWLWTPFHGWVWVPGRVWAPAWVVWMSGPDWVGWSPMPPEWCDGYWRHHDYHRHHRRWVFVQDHGFLCSNAADHRLPEARVKRDFDRDYVVREKNGQAFSHAPERVAMEKAAGRPAAEVRQRRGVDIRLERDPRVKGESVERRAATERTRDQAPNTVHRQDRQERQRMPSSESRSREAAGRTRAAMPREQPSVAPQSRGRSEPSRAYAPSPDPQSPRAERTARHERSRERATPSSRSRR